MAMETIYVDNERVDLTHYLMGCEGCELWSPLWGNVRFKGFSKDPEHPGKYLFFEPVFELDEACHFSASYTTDKYGCTIINNVLGPVHNGARHTLFEMRSSCIIQPLGGQSWEIWFKNRKVKKEFKFNSVRM